MLTPVQSASAADTRRIGARIGERARAGDVICLVGDLGAGKTQLAQGIATGLGVPPERVTSPTYTLIAEYYGGRLPLYHMDAYRISVVEQLAEIGFDDYISRADGVVVIEWADRIDAALPPERLQITLDADLGPHGDTNRRILVVDPRGERAAALAASALGIV